MVWDESKLVVDRVNRSIATMGVVIQSATMTTGMGASRKAGEHFSDLVKSLNGEK